MGFADWVVIPSSCGNAGLQNGRAAADFSRSRTQPGVSWRGLVQVPCAGEPASHGLAGLCHLVVTWRGISRSSGRVGTCPGPAWHGAVPKGSNILGDARAELRTEPMPGSGDQQHFPALLSSRAEPALQAGEKAGSLSQLGISAKSSHCSLPCNAGRWASSNHTSCHKSSAPRFHSVVRST